MKKPLSLLLLAALATGLTVPVLAVGPSFIPEVVFSGSSLAGFHPVGQADWRAANGEITGKPRSADGGLLVLDHGYQDVGIYTEFRFTQGTQAGVIFRIQKSAGGGMTGIYADLSDPDMTTYNVTLDANGKIVSKEKARRGGGLVRFIPPPNPNAPAPPPFRPPPPAAGLPYKAPDTDLKPGDWNTVEMFMDANDVRVVLNDGRERAGVTENQFGPFAFYVAGSGEVTFRNIKYKDLSHKVNAVDYTSPNFRRQTLTGFYESFAVTAADIDKDGNLDVISGPNVFFGPDFTKSREIYPAETFSQASAFSGDAWIESAYDFTGDGWPDIVTTNYGSLGITLYVNPGKESRRWDKYQVVKEVQSEVAAMRDVDGDGKPEIVYMGGGQVRYAKPDPGNPTGPWIVKNVSEKGFAAAHGIGVGDVNGDGKMDILNPYGWWENPGTPDGTWKFHPEVFGRYGHGIFGGAIMGVYDVNGDGRADVVTALNAHGWGLAWFEQKPDGHFERHMIADDLTTQSTNAGGVAFSEPHASAFADVDGDGIPDFIVGKRYLSHVNTFLDPDPFGQPVLYIYHTVRDKSAPGGARFVPELIDNQSGAGSDILAVDLNKDGAIDIVTPTRFGTILFWGKPGAEKSHKWH